MLQENIDRYKKSKSIKSVIVLLTFLITIVSIIIVNTYSSHEIWLAPFLIGLLLFSIMVDRKVVDRLKFCKDILYQVERDGLDLKEVIQLLLENNLNEESYYLKKLVTHYE